MHKNMYYVDDPLRIGGLKEEVGGSNPRHT